MIVRRAIFEVEVPVVVAIVEGIYVSAVDLSPLHLRILNIIVLFYYSTGFSSPGLMRFEQISYQGSIKDGVMHLDPIVLIEGFRDDITFSLHGGKIFLFFPLKFNI